MSRPAVPSNLIVRADRNRLRQVLVNLLDNAIKYQIPVVALKSPRSPAATKLSSRYKDTGEGIPTEEVPRIWERLYRGDKSRSQRGLGLGLSLVRAIINAHGSGIEVQSCQSAKARASPFTCRTGSFSVVGMRRSTALSGQQHCAQASWPEDELIEVPETAEERFVLNFVIETSGEPGSLNSSWDASASFIFTGASPVSMPNNSARFATCSLFNRFPVGGARIRLQDAV